MNVASFLPTDPKVQQTVLIVVRSHHHRIVRPPSRKYICQCPRSLETQIGQNVLGNRNQLIRHILKRTVFLVAIETDFISIWFYPDIPHGCAIRISGNHDVQPTVIVHIEKDHGTMTQRFGFHGRLILEIHALDRIACFRIFAGTAFFPQPVTVHFYIKRQWFEHVHFFKTFAVYVTKQLHKTSVVCIAGYQKVHISVFVIITRYDRSISVVFIEAVVIAFFRALGKFNGTKHFVFHRFKFTVP